MPTGLQACRTTDCGQPHETEDDNICSIKLLVLFAKLLPKAYGCRQLAMAFQLGVVAL